MFCFVLCFLRIKFIRLSGSESPTFKNTLHRMSKLSEKLGILRKRKSVVVFYSLVPDLAFFYLFSVPLTGYF